MTDFGHLKVTRKRFATPERGGFPLWHEKREFSRFEAWMYLEQEAAWAPHDFIPPGQKPIRLQRGETRPLSIRYLLQAWGWGSKKRVEKFLDLLIEMGEIRTAQRTQNGDTYLIVNYDVEQGSGYSNGDTDGYTGGDSAGDKREARKAREAEKAGGEEEANASLSGSGKPNRDGDVQRVWTHWVEVSGKAKSKLTPGRRTKIKTRLRTFTADELCKAIDGAHRNPFYLGDNERGTYYGDIETIFKNDEAVTKHMEWEPQEAAEGAGRHLTIVPSDLLSREAADRAAAEREKQEAENAERAEKAWKRAVHERFAALSEDERERWKEKAKEGLRHLEEFPERHERALKLAVFQQFGAHIGLTLDHFLKAS